jgi:hypothetical protein
MGAEQGEVQVGGDFYDFQSYVTFERWSSYWYQIVATLRYRPASVLEIGVGLGVTTQVLRGAGVAVTTCDFDPALKPDVVGDVRKLDQLVAPKSVDMVCAFQILEHIPFEDFEPAVAKLAGIARRHVVISLPQWGRPVELRARLLKNRFTLHFARRLYHRKDWKFDGQHYWEVGAKGYPPERIHEALSRQLRVLRSYVCPDNSYHYFFECEVKEPAP